MNPELEGCLVGQAIGDMMGLPYEHLSPRRVAKLARFDRLCFFFGFGSSSDDTEHAGLTAEAVRFANGNPERFAKRLASGLRLWFLAGPPGIGLGTLKACVKLCLGFPPSRSGVRAAGNGPAMRATVLGVMVPAEQLREFNRLSTRITHTDPRAEIGSLFIAQLASGAKTIDPTTGAEWIESRVAEFANQPELEPLIENMRKAAVALRAGKSLREFAAEMGPKGISGFIAHTVPAAVFAFFRHPTDYRTAIEEVIRCGGDTDTVAAIVGALIGIRVGVKGIPEMWRTRHCDWPWSLRRLTRLRRPWLIEWPLIFVRNLAFFGVVLVHLVRRRLPPW
jgi:ADP-ribosyl-[dinitrogen reductase] hydrolase